jgi:tRNA/rRNA methyltransferase
VTAKVVLVLVEPAGPLNVGSVARLCANYEISQLRLVAPRCDQNDPQARLMAVRGGQQLAGAQCFERLADALADCGRVLACSGRREQQERPHLAPAEALAWLLQPPMGPATVALVFGREDHGLHNDELDQAGRLLRIPTGPSYGSLNLSHAVAICLATLEQQRQNTVPSSAVSTSALPPQGALEATLTELDEQVAAVGGRLYLAKDSRQSAAMFQRTYPRLQEWQQARRQLDPRGVFSSDLARRVGID